MSTQALPTSDIGTVDLMPTQPLCTYGRSWLQQIRELTHHQPIKKLFEFPVVVGKWI